MNRYCPNCGTPRIDELPIFCNEKCENEYRKWIADGGDIKLLKYEKQALTKYSIPPR